MSESSNEMQPQHSLLPQEGDWFVLHTRSRQEKALASDLQSQQIGVFLPTVEQVRFYGRRKMRSQLPMFPGYLFLRGSRDDAFTADRTKRVANIIEVPLQQELHWVLSNIALAMAKEAPLDAHPYLQAGVRAEVRSGPFKGLQGIVEDRLDADRLLLQVEMLGRAMSLELDGALLEPVQ